MRLQRIVLVLFVPLLMAATINDKADLDPVSSACLDCHDGSSAIHVNFCLLGQPTEGCGGHIISASYSDFAAKDKNLHPAESLPPEIALYEGKITCATCHGADPHLGNALVIDNRDNVLCRACHRK